MATLGTAYVQIVPSAQGISGKIQQVLDPEARAAGTSAGSSISTNLGKGLTTVGSKMTSCITKPVLAAGAALGGLSLAKGFARMSEVDSARVKIEKLGESFDGINFEGMKNAANAAVKDTAFTLNEGLTTAANAAAAGIKQTDMEGYLKGVANAAAFAGVPMDEMGQIFNKVAAQGKLSGETLQQFSDRGVPAVALLAKSTGMSMDEVTQAVSEGKIGVEELQGAFLGLGDTFASDMGSKTIQGTITNIMAAFGRIGANLIGDSSVEGTIANKILPLLQAFKDALGPIEDKAAELGGKLAENVGPAMETLTRMLSGGATAAEMAKLKFGAAGAGIATAMGPALLIVGKGVNLFGTFKDKIGLLAEALNKPSGSLLKMGGLIGVLVAAFIVAYTKSESFRNAINQLATIIGGALMQVFAAISPLIKTAGELFVTLATAAGNILGPILVALMPVIQKVIAVFVRVVTVVATFVTAILSIATKITSVPGKVKAVFEKVKRAIHDKIMEAKQKVASVVRTIKNTMSFSGLVSKVQGVFNKIKSKITAPIESARKAVKKAIDKIKGLFPLSVGKIMSNLKVPKINIKGGSPPFGIAGKGKKPSISISWNKKAMDNPYMFSNATLFGAGEAGDEVLYGRSSLMRDISEAVSNTGANGDIVIYLSYDASADANDMARDIARGVKRYRMAGAF